MTPHEFLSKWRNVELKERSASQTHFNDLCALLGVPDPVSADPAGEWFTFEKGASKTSGGEGWADVWRRECFGWEYKGRHANLDRAYNQLLQYAVALENPPLLIVSDMDRIVVRTNFTNSVQEVHEFATADLADAGLRDRLRAAFLDPEAFRPKKTRQELTEETAAEFAGLAQRLRDRGHHPGQVAHFVNRLVFCMFAEDVGLLPDKLFTRMLERARPQPDAFVGLAEMLFGAMATGGAVGFETVDWFNGGLFDDGHALPVSASDLDDLLRAARRDWSQIDPSILGTLFERGLDPAKRSQLGAHYTDRDKIMLIVRPTIIEPLEAEWAEVRRRIAALVDSAPRRTADRLLTPAEKRRVDKLMAEAAALHSAFIERLAGFRVLDPACGSGNFLYVALRALKDIEHRANLDAEALGLPRGFPRVGPENVLGIELNPYAAELARVSVWIGEIQWMRRNGFDAARNPILRPLETIECRDAVLAGWAERHTSSSPRPPSRGPAVLSAEESGTPDQVSLRESFASRGDEEGEGIAITRSTRAEWPAADVIIGNPPFLGASKILGELGDEYTSALRRAWPEVPGFADLVCYWFAKAWAMMVDKNVERVGLVATNSIRGGANREVLKQIAEHGHITNAWSDEPWTLDGAAVRVSVICFDQDAGEARLNGAVVDKILPDLTANTLGFDLTRAERLPSNGNIAAYGSQQKGSFGIDAFTARNLLRKPNPHGRPNSEVLKRSVNAVQVTRRNTDGWAVDFGLNMPEADAALYEGPYAYVREKVFPERVGRRDSGQAKRWWLHARPSPIYRNKAAELPRYIVSPAVAKHRLFVWLSPLELADHALLTFARDDDTTFGILHSRFHKLWALRMGTFLGVGNDPRYTPSTTFETFPFPDGLTPDIPAADYAGDPRAQAIAAAAARLNELRENWLNPADLVVRESEVVPGYPDRILPRDAEAAAELKKRTLTNLYNARPQWLANAHRALDEAVADAYGWGEDWRGGVMGEDEILARLFRLNQQRGGVAAG